MSSLLGTLIDRRVASRIWRRDPTVFAEVAPAAALHDEIANRLGWLEAARGAGADQAEIEAFTHAVARDGLTQMCLLGMGGSSLCAEVLRELRAAAAAGTFFVLDSTDERTIDQVGRALDPKRTLFLVASKSGSTIEVSSLERHFWSKMTAALGESAGRHFVAITDPGTPLDALAAEKRYRHTFLNSPDIGGRYSVLSFFGLVPASLLGLNVQAMLTASARMAASCAADDPANPGLRLAAFMAEQAARGRDKLSILVPTPLSGFGQWIEQLVAESTGKDGRGILPVVDEPDGDPSEFGPDRAFVVTLMPNARALAARADALQAAGHPVFRIETTPADLGAEFVRWEFATAVAGVALGIDPFDEPNVRDAKARTQSQLETFRSTGALRVEPPLVQRHQWKVREHRPAAPAAPPHGAGRFIALLDYLPTDRARVATIERIRHRLRKLTRAATIYGVGPRYLHSTGQYHKGGANTGLFVIVTGADETATPVPGAGYTFSVLKHAQALGDFEALVAAGRHVVHYHCDNPAADFSAELERILTVQFSS